MVTSLASAAAPRESYASMISLVSSSSRLLKYRYRADEAMPRSRAMARRLSAGAPSVAR